MINYKGKMRARRWQAQHRRKYFFRYINGHIVDRPMFYFTSGM